MSNINEGEKKESMMHNRMVKGIDNNMNNISIVLTNQTLPECFNSLNNNGMTIFCFFVFLSFSFLLRQSRYKREHEV